MKRLVIFASGTGSNARKIAEYFADRPAVEIALVLSNKATAGVLPMAESNGIPTRVFSRSEFVDSDVVLAELQAINPDLIVLAGFLWLIPANLIKAFPNKIVNIHPALLPKFGGKGMYGHHVHEAVVAAGETETGPTIHYVNEHFDEGEIIFQARCPVFAHDTAEAVAARVLQLEHQHFATVIDDLLNRPGAGLGR